MYNFIHFGFGEVLGTLVRFAPKNNFVLFRMISKPINYFMTEAFMREKNDFCSKKYRY